MELFLCKNITRREDAYALLDYAARRRWGLARLPDLARGEQGKPYFPAFPDYHFNISHSGHFALCALDGRPVGVDIEVIRPHHPNLTQRICSTEELDWLEGQEDQVNALCKLWTRKEALVKYRGTGLTMPLREICPPLPPLDKQDGLQFNSIIAREFCACVCGETLVEGTHMVSREEICP